jgi:hypothetical protein
VPGGAAAELATEGAETLVVYGSDGIELRTGSDREDASGNPINNVGNVLTNEALVPGGLDPTERTPAVRGNVTKTFQAAWIVAHKHLYTFLIDARQVTCPVAAPCGPFHTESLLATSANPVFSAPVLATVHGNAAFSSIVVVNETDNIVMAFDGTTGGLQWSSSLPNDLRGLTQAVTDGNDIDVAAPGKVEIFNIQNPNLQCHPNCAPKTSVPLSDPTPPSHIILGADVIFVSHGSVVDAVPNRCGPGPCLPLWTHTMDRTVTGISESDGHLYVSTQTGVTAFTT